MAGAGRRSRAATWMRAGGRLVLLVSLGFGAGVGIGLLAEEPKLLLGHLRGESEVVPLVSAGPASERGESEGADAALAGAVPTAARDADRSGHEAAGASEAPAAPEAKAEPEAGSTRRLAHARAETRAQAGSSGRPAEKPPAVSAAAAPAVPDAPRDAWAIQVGAFSQRSAAVGLADRLSARGYAARVLPGEGESGRFRVRVQPIDGEDRARSLAARLKQEERLPTWVLRLKAPTGS